MAELPKISVVTDEGELKRLGPSWNRLLKYSFNNTIFLTWEWVMAWWHSYGAGKEMWILKVERDEQLVGLAPLYRKRFRKFGVLQYQGLYLLGDGSADSDYLDVISRVGEEEWVCRAVVSFLLEHWDEWDILFLHEVPATSTHLKLLRKFFQEKGCYWEEDEVPCAYVKLPTEWDNYLQRLQPRMRTKIRSLMRRLEKNHTVRVNCCTKPEELETCLDSLFEQHGRRWSMKGKDGVFLWLRKRQFYHEISRLFLSYGWLRFYSLSVDGNYVAHQFCFEYQGNMFLLQEGFNPEWAAHGVGNVLRGYVFRDCIERKVAVYDFLAGVTFHKLSWGAQTKTNVRVRVGIATTKNLIFFYVPHLLQRLEEMLKRMLPSPILEWTKHISSSLLKIIPSINPSCHTDLSREDTI